MHYLGLALYAEGASDYHFLGPLLLRLCEDLCLEAATGIVEFPEAVLALDSPAGMNSSGRAQRVVEAARQARGAWRIVFVHADSDGNETRARAERAQPAIDLLEQEFAGQGLGVAVIPIRETEAWVLADGDALRRAMGTRLSDAQLGLPPNPAAVESLGDPKAVLDGAWQNAKSGRRRPRSISPLLVTLGGSIALGRLRQLTAFQQLETELKRALSKLGVLP